MNEYETQQVIRQWVSDNFGESEAKDPSWNIEALAKHIADHENKKNECNGWSNYATWRINLEMVDGEADAIRESGEVYDTVRDLADHLELMVDDHLDMIEAEDNSLQEFNPLRSYADAFIEQVNWYEIAENMAQDNPEFVKEKK